MSTTPTYAPHELRVIQEKIDLDEKRIKLRNFIEDRPKFFTLDVVGRTLLESQLHVMNGYSAILGQRIARFTPRAQHPAVAAMQPLESDGKAIAPRSSTMPSYEQHEQRLHRPGLDLTSDTPLAPACDLSGDGTCEACQ